MNTNVLKIGNHLKVMKRGTTILLLLFFFIDPFYAKADLIQIRFANQLSERILSAEKEERESETIHESNLPQDIRSGKVTNEEGQPVPGVNILVKGTTIGTVTDAEGNYTINVPDNSVLTFSFIGFITQEVPVAQRDVINIILVEDATYLQEVVVVGYGSQSRETVTTSISKLDNKVLANLPYSNAASALQGSLAGVTVQNLTGQPGAAPRVIVRGGTSINNPNGSSPLYIVDGIIRSNLDDINPGDIESLQVLKDAAATSIYGARGSNGVVILTTKSGKAGKSTISYSYRLSTSEASKLYDLVGAKDYIYYSRLGIMATARKMPSRLGLLTSAVSFGTGNDLTNNTAYSTQYLTTQNSHKLNEGWQSMADPLDPTKTIIFDEVDWQDVLFRTGISHDHTLSASGGTEKATFNASLGYLANEGAAIGTDYTRATFNLNGDLELRHNLKFFGRLAYSNSNLNGTSIYNPAGSASWSWGRSQYAPPTLKYKFEDGTIAPGDYFPSPEYLISRQVGKNKRGTLTMSTGAHWEILPGLSFDPLISLFSVNTDNRFFLKSAYLASPVNFNTNRNASGSHNEMSQQQADAVFTYTKTFSNHFIEAKAGFAYFGNTNSYLYASGQDAATDLIPTLNASATPVNVTSTESQHNMIGYFGRVNYNFKQKYLISLNARYDGSSNLGTANKWGLFPGISLGWNLHEEDFWHALPEDLIRMKLRGSFGVNGNISGLGPYQAQGQYSVGARYGGNAVVRNTIIANPELQWEQSKTLDVGMDLGLFSSKVNVIVDYYRRVTDNLLTNYSIPLSTGFTSILTNLGSLENRGLEIELSAFPLPSTSNFQWEVSLNAAKVKNKILKLPANGVKNNRIGGVYVWDQKSGGYDWLGGLQEGGTMGDLYAYKQVGIYKTDDEAAAGPLDILGLFADKTKYGGDTKWLDVDGNNIIDTRDRVYMGNAYPTLSGGISNSFRFKNFNFLVRMDFTTGQTKYDYRKVESLSSWGAFGGIVSDVKKSWQKPGDITNIPKYYWVDYEQNIFRGNSEFYMKGDYLCLRELTLSYNVPTKILQRLKLSNLRVNLTGNNLHYFTGYTGLSPEDTGYGGSAGFDYGGYVVPRNIILGLNISL